MDAAVNSLTHLTVALSMTIPCMSSTLILLPLFVPAPAPAPAPATLCLVRCFWDGGKLAAFFLADFGGTLLSLCSLPIVEVEDRADAIDFTGGESSRFNPNIEFAVFFRIGAAGAGVDITGAGTGLGVGAGAGAGAGFDFGRLALDRAALLLLVACGGVIFGFCFGFCCCCCCCCCGCCTTGG